MRFARRPSQTSPHAMHQVERVDTAARRTPAQHAHLALPRYLPIVVLLLAIWACGGGHLNISITHHPTSDLRLVLHISDQYSDKPDVQVLAQIFEDTNSQPVFLAESARLTCNGSDIKPNASSGSFVHPCPRQAPGGTYRIAYTDEHGGMTTVNVPIPVGSFAILTPRPNSMIPIPTNGSLEVRYSTPIPPAHGSVRIAMITAVCGASGSMCGAVASSPQDNTIATPSVPPGSGSVAATPVTESCATQDAPKNPPATTSGGQGIFPLTGDFSMFQPGPGSIDMVVEACVMPDRGGFAAATANFLDGITAPITWTR